MQVNLNNSFSEKIVGWYQTNKRDLPWRHTTNPYNIWLSEIILQQTRVAQGLPYYHKFVEALPTINHFAEATESEILRLWQGLGYYSRARNMHFTAKYIAQNLNGIFPPNFKGLIKLKGIGNYTAAAIASFAYNEHIAVVDGNVFRVLSRFFGIEADIASPKGKAQFSEIANQLLPITQSNIYNQAIMEFGALQCVPKSPQCHICVLNTSCYAFKAKSQTFLPVNNKKIKVQIRYFYYLVIEFEGDFFLNKRQESGIWQGLFDFYLVEKQNPENIIDLLSDQNLIEIMNSSVIVTNSETYKHQLTHQKLYIQFIHLKITDAKNLFFKENKDSFYNLLKIETLPKPIILANFIKKYLDN